jgi:hypothetical protein
MLNMALFVFNTYVSYLICHGAFEAIISGIKNVHFYDNYSSPDHIEDPKHEALARGFRS